jgi:hypothetical protein
MTTRELGSVPNPGGRGVEINVWPPLVILGSSAVAAYVGWRIGGPQGAAVGALVGAFVGALAAGLIRKFRVVLHPNGKVEVEYETWFQARPAS